MIKLYHAQPRPAAFLILFTQGTGFRYSFAYFTVPLLCTVRSLNGESRVYVHRFLLFPLMACVIYAGISAKQTGRLSFAQHPALSITAGCCYSPIGTTDVIFVRLQTQLTSWFAWQRKMTQ